MNKEERKKYIFAQLRSLPNATNYVEVTKYFENLEQQCKKQKELINKIYELIKQHIRKDEFLELNEWQTRDLLDLLKEVSE